MLSTCAAVPDEFIVGRKLNPPLARFEYCQRSPRIRWVMAQGGKLEWRVSEWLHDGR
jgi:hypothetical protein